MFSKLVQALLDSSLSICLVTGSSVLGGAGDLMVLWSKYCVWGWLFLMLDLQRDYNVLVVGWGFRGSG